MRIVYLYQYFNTPDMPGGSRAYEVTTRLAARGHDVHVVTSVRDSAGSSGWYETNESGVHVHWLPVRYANQMGLLERMRAFVKFALRAVPRAIAIAPEIVFATSTPLTIAVPGIAASRWHRVPLVFEVRDLWPTVPIAMGALKNPGVRAAARLLEWIAYRSSTRIVALSPGMAEGIEGSGFPPSRITVIPNGCDLDHFDPGSDAGPRFRDEHPELGTGPLVLYAGTLGKANGVGYLAEVASVLRDRAPDARIVVIGKGAEEDDVRTLATELGVLDRNFFMYPPMAKKDVAAAFASADVVTSVFVDLPELEANSANKFFDGLAAGRPVAVNYGGWQADLLEESGAGFVLDRDVQRAAASLTVWLRDEPRLSAAGRAARRLAEERFARDDLAEQVEDVLLDALAAKSRR